jgi:hypothetical protein
VSLAELSEERLAGLADVELLGRVDELVARFEELDPRVAGDALGGLVQELGERYWPEAVLAQLRGLVLERGSGVGLGAVREGMARRAALRAAGGRWGSAGEDVVGWAGLGERERVERFEGGVGSAGVVGAVGCLDHLDDLESEGG